MKKLLILALISFTANADVWVKQIETVEGKGYAFAFPRNGVLNCWVMPEWVQISYFDLAWMTVPDTAINHSWPAGTQETATICANGPQIPRTVGGNLYSINPRFQTEVIGSVPSGIVCGDPIIRFNFLRSVTYNGQTGFAWCQ